MNKDQFEDYLLEIISNYSDNLNRFTYEVCELIATKVNFLSHEHKTRKTSSSPRVLPNIETEQYIVEQRSSQLKRVDKCCYKTPFNLALILAVSVEILGNGDDIPSKKDLFSNAFKHLEIEAFDGNKLSNSTWKQINNSLKNFK